MTLEEIKDIIKHLTLAQDDLLDLPLEWIEEAAAKDIDTLHTSNILDEIVDFLKDKLQPQ